METDSPGFDGRATSLAALVRGETGSERRRGDYTFGTSVRFRRVGWKALIKGQAGG